MKKILKYMVYAVSIVLFVSIVSITYIFIRLPSPTEIAAKLPSKSRTEPETSRVIDKEKLADANLKNENATEAKFTTQKTSSEDMSVEEKTFNDALGKEIFDYEGPISKTCDNLSKAASSLFTDKNFIESFQGSLGSDPEDPFLQAFLAPLKKAVRLPKMKAFFEEVSLYKEKNMKASLLDKGYFYTKALTAVNEIKENKDELNIASDRAYRMYALSRAIQKKPGLAQDSAVRDFCYQLQNAIENTSNVDRQVENAEFLRFLNYAGLDSKEVGYDPKFQTDFKVEMSDGNLKIGLGWLGQEMVK